MIGGIVTLLIMLWSIWLEVRGKLTEKQGWFIVGLAVISGVIVNIAIQKVTS